MNEILNKRTRWLWQWKPHPFVEWVDFVFGGVHFSKEDVERVFPAFQNPEIEYRLIRREEADFLA